MRTPHPATICSFIVLLSTSAAADTSFRLDLCSDSRTTGWAFYCEPPEPPKPIEEIEEPPLQAMPAITPPSEPAEPELGPATQAIHAYRAMVDEAKYLAVLDPTPENVQAYMELNKDIADRAGAFTDQWQRILFGTPHLNANVDYPLAAAGVTVYQDQLKAAREASFRETAATRGILFFTENPIDCGICVVQGQVLAAMQDTYGVSILAVSRDGVPLPTFPDVVEDQGQLSALGLADFPAPTLAIIDPQENTVDVIGSGLLTADQILERVYVITQIPVGERY